MKLLRYIKNISGVLMISSGVLVTSCDFLDIVPPEQAKLADATKDADATEGFLYSCYAGIQNPITYTRPEASADEYALPQVWNHAAHKFAFDLNIPQDGTEQRWNICYNFIGQIHLFLQELPKAKGITNEQYEMWQAEAYFLLAYYHFEILRFYGPCPITESYLAHSTPNDQFPGRSHYDAVTNWIVDVLDNNVIKGYKLPFERNTNEVGRATHAIACALKAKALLYAASPLWNGSFPYPDWTNKVESSYGGVDYGKELVSKTFSRDKWTRALEACKTAISEANSAGHHLYGGEGYETDLDFYTTMNTNMLNNVYIPGGADNNFKKRVLLFRYLSSTRSNEGNKEIVWGVDKNDDWMLECQMPYRLLQRSNGNWIEGYESCSPYLNSMERFYMADGTLLNKSQSNLLERSGIDASRPDIINLAVGREPRFYAWMAFDQGDWSTMCKDGQPLRIEMKDKETQGYWPDRHMRDHCITGFLSQKFIRPERTYDKSGNVNGVSFPRPLIRMAELYLNVAECYAMLDDTDNALINLNKVHERAGLDPIEKSDLNAQHPIMEWIRNERFVELWGEGHRYFDVRRWVMGPEYLAAGKREGLNAETIIGPTFEQFNQRIKVNQPYKWTRRMYIAPAYQSEVGKNQQLVQAPGY